MNNENLLEIHYRRVIKSEEVVLTTENCNEYGYVATKKDYVVNGETKTYDVFYEQGKTEEEVLTPDLETGETIIIHNTYQTYSHIAPPCSKYEFSYADVDKDGSGRNSLTGEMFRERVGSYTMLNVAWDLIPNTKEYNNWYRILTQLPPKVTLKLLTPNGEIEEVEMYRGDITTKLYLFVKDRQIWQGLATTFTQWNVVPYDDTYEPTLEVV